MNAVPRAQGGLALIGALFVLVVLAALGAFAVRIDMTQQHAAELELQELRARAALDAGVEYAAARLLASSANNCGTLANFNNYFVGGFSVTFGCALLQPRPQVNGVTVNLYTVNVTASQGVYGTPDFVSRTARIRISS